MCKHGKATQHKAERLRDIIISAHTRSLIAAKLPDAYLVCEDGALIFPWVASVLLPSYEADRRSCSSSVVSCAPEKPSQTRNAGLAESTTP